MILFALLAIGLPAQEIPYAGAAERYAPPVVRPFEPPSDFGRATAQGDGDGGPHRRPIPGPVVVDSYVRSYEVSPSDGEVLYEQGVAQAEINADSLSGPLDGRWRVIDADGRIVLDLVLSDPSGARPVEGAWRRPDAEPLMGPILSVVRDDAVVLIAASGGDRPMVLRLHSTDDGWAGALTGAGHDRPVVMTRPK